MSAKPTLLGQVGAVTGAAISVRQSPGVASGIVIIGGKSYRIGQVGSFVRIPQGYHDLYGIVAEVPSSRCVCRTPLIGARYRHRYPTT